MWCFHDRLRQFTFSDGTQIQMCPDCTTFDNQRRELFKQGNIEVPKAAEETHWGLILDKLGLSMDAGLSPLIEYAGDMTGALKAMLERSPRIKIIDINGQPTWVDNPYRLAEYRFPEYKTPMDDHEWVERQRPFPHTLTMPRPHRAYCVNCTEVVLSVRKPWLVRITKGVYLPIEHECNTVRVYDLKGTLLEVKAQ